MARCHDVVCCGICAGISRGDTIWRGSSMFPVLNARQTTADRRANYRAGVCAVYIRRMLLVRPADRRVRECVCRSGDYGLRDSASGVSLR